MMWPCDWPDGGKQCGAEAPWFLDQGTTHRPICTACLAKVTPQPADHFNIGVIDPTKVPGPGFILDRSANPPPPPVNPVTPPGWRLSWERSEKPTPQPSRPPLKDAFADLASALLDLGLKKVDEWRKR
jgi:hypothetical protein